VTTIVLKKQLSFKNYVFVCIFAVRTRHANRIFPAVHFIVVCRLSVYLSVCLSVSTIFLHIISHTTRLLENIFEHKVYISIFCTSFV